MSIEIPIKMPIKMHIEIVGWGLIFFIVNLWK